MAHNQIAGAAAFYKPAKGIYRAGFILSAPPVNLPAELTYEKFSGGKYTRFTLIGPFDQLPEANSRAFGVVSEKGIAIATTSASNTTLPIRAQRPQSRMSRKF